MAKTAKIDPSKSLPANASIDEQVAYWTARVAEMSTGTRGRLAEQSLHLAIQAQAQEQKAQTKPLEGGGTTDAAAATKQYAADAAAAIPSNEEKINQNSGGSEQLLNAPTPTVTTPAKTPPPVSNSGFATNHNGLLNSNGVPYTGEKDGKFYDAGKLQTPAEVKQQFLAKYGMASSFISSVPELGGKGINGKPSLIDQAIAGNWSADNFKQAYMNSQWYQKNGGTYATEEQDRLAAPGTYATNYNNLLKEMTLQAQSQGISIDNLGGPITSDQAKSLDPNANPVVHLLQSYYNQTVPADILSTFIAKAGTVAKQTTGTLEGSLATTAQQLKTYAQSMGINPNTLPAQWTGATGQGAASGDWFSSAADAAQKGFTTTDSLQAGLRTQAAGIYKPFAQQINNGASVQDLASSYLGAASNLLEKPVSSFTLGDYTGTNGLVTKALQGDGTQSVPLDQFMTQVKQTPDWLNTSNARNSIMDTASQLLGGMGLVN